MSHPAESLAALPAVSLAVDGAVAANAPDTEVAGHYGDPYGEQRQLATGPAIIDRSHRGVIVLDGPERLTWLHQLTTQALENLPPHLPIRTLVLSPHGHIEHAAELIDDGERTWLLTEPLAAQGFSAFLDRMRFMTRVEVRDATAEFATFTVTGLDVPGAAVTRPRADGSHDALVPRAEAAAFWLAMVQSGAKPAGYDAFEALRIAAGDARPGMDTDHRSLVHEVGYVESAVHLSKGCYRGQETVARVHNLGKPPRRLVTVHLDGSDHELPARGSELVSGEKVVGALTSVARHHELGPIGLAIVRRNVPDEAALRAGDVAVAIDRDVSSPTAPVDLSGIRPGR